MPTKPRVNKTVGMELLHTTVGLIKLGFSSEKLCGVMFSLRLFDSGYVWYNLDRGITIVSVGICDISNTTIRKYNHERVGPEFCLSMGSSHMSFCRQTSYMFRYKQIGVGR